MVGGARPPRRGAGAAGSGGLLCQGMERGRPQALRRQPAAPGRRLGGFRESAGSAAAARLGHPSMLTGTLWAGQGFPWRGCGGRGGQELHSGCPGACSRPPPPRARRPPRARCNACGRPSRRGARVRVIGLTGDAAPAGVQPPPQGNIIYPCGYMGGAKDRVSAVCTFEEHEVSLSSATGIAQIEKDKEFQLEQEQLCLQLGNMLSDEAMDHVKKMCGPGYTLENGKPVPIEPEEEGSTTAKGPGFFIQPNSLTPGTGVEGYFGDNAKLPEDDVAYICKVGVAICSRTIDAAHPPAAYPALSACASFPFVLPLRTPQGFRPSGGPDMRVPPLQFVEDDQAEIKSACIQYFLQFFKAMDEDGKGVLVGDAFKTVIGKLEEDMPMEAKEVWALSCLRLRANHASPDDDMQLPGPSWPFT